MASEGSGPPPSVVVDANLLYPFHLRNLLVQFGVDSVIAPRWTTRINAEWIGNLVAAGRAPEERLLLTLDLMNSALPEAEVRGWEARMDGLALPDPDDHHVLAAALAAGAETILTMNLRDFPASALTPHGVVAVHPDEFLCGLHDADPELLRASTAAAHANLSRSTPSLAAYLDVLDRQGLPQLTHRLRMQLLAAGRSPELAGRFRTGSLGVTSSAKRTLRGRSGPSSEDEQLRQSNSGCAGDVPLLQPYRNNRSGEQ